MILHDIGISGEFIELNSATRFSHVAGWLANPALQHVNYYFRLKLLRNANRPIDELLDEYYTEFYGPAAGPMRRFFQMMEDTYMGEHLRNDGKMYKTCRKGKGCYQSDLPEDGAPAHLTPKDSWEIYCPPDRLAEFDRILQEAEKAAAGQQPYAERVELIRHAVYDFMKHNSERWFRTGLPEGHRDRK
jgi:hypothetical protein